MQKPLLYVVTVVGYIRGHYRCSNVWLSKEDAANAIKTNHFDIWEGFNNQYAVIEEMEPGAPWTCKEVAWFAHERIMDEDGKKYNHLVYETDKPKEYQGICNFGVG